MPWRSMQSRPRQPPMQSCQDAMLPAGATPPAPPGQQVKNSVIGACIGPTRQKNPAQDARQATQTRPGVISYPATTRPPQPAQAALSTGIQGHAVRINLAGGGGHGDGHQKTGQGMRVNIRAAGDPCRQPRHHFQTARGMQGDLHPPNPGPTGKRYSRQRRSTATTRPGCARMPDKARTDPAAVMTRPGGWTAQRALQTAAGDSQKPDGVFMGCL